MLVCKRHKNTADDLECTKSLDLGTRNPLTEKECLRRLKCWYISAGTLEREWDSDTKRTQHQRFGGFRLAHLSSDGPWGDHTDEQLDEQVRKVAAS